MSGSGVGESGETEVAVCGSSRASVPRDETAARVARPAERNDVEHGLQRGAPTHRLDRVPLERAPHPRRDVRLPLALDPARPGEERLALAALALEVDDGELLARVLGERRAQRGLELRLARGEEGRDERGEVGVDVGDCGRAGTG